MRKLNLIMYLSLGERYSTGIACKSFLLVRLIAPLEQFFKKKLGMYHLKVIGPQIFFEKTALMTRSGTLKEIISRQFQYYIFLLG